MLDCTFAGPAAHAQASLIPGQERAVSAPAPPRCLYGYLRVRVVRVAPFSGGSRLSLVRPSWTTVRAPWSVGILSECEALLPLSV